MSTTVAAGARSASPTTRSGSLATCATRSRRTPAPTSRSSWRACAWCSARTSSASTRAGVARADDAVLNACRALRFAEEGRWSSKQDAGVWARDRLADGALAADALAARRGSGDRLEGARVQRFLEAARRSLEHAAGRAGPFPHA